MTGSERTHDGPSWFGRMVRDGWLIGIAMVVIVGAIASPFVRSYFGYGVRYRSTGTPGPLFEASDVFIVVGAILGAWCIGWAASKLIDRWIQRAGRPRGWVRLLVIVVSFAAMLSLQYVSPIRTAYSQGVIIGCVIIVMSKIERALFDDENGRDPV
jgi:Kef-type K+ transport system membrane component KefB